MIRLIILFLVVIFLLGYWQGGGTIKQTLRKGVGAGCGLGFVALVFALIIFFLLIR